MAYLGNVPAEAYSSIVKDTFSGNNTDVAFTLSQPATTNGLRVVISDVIQEPSVDYTCSGTTLTFTSAPATGTDNIYVVHLGAAVQTVDPPTEITNATTYTSDLTVQGAFTSVGIDDNATSTAMTLDSSGNLQVGTTQTFPAFNNVVGCEVGGFGQISASRDGAEAMQLNRKTSDGNIALFKKDGTTVGSIASVSGGMQIYATGVNNTGWTFGNGSAVLPMKNSALSDNFVDLGSASYRMDDIYATNGTIQTSDLTLKQDIAELDEAEKRVATAAKGLIRKYRWIDSVEEKGDDARIHVGVIAQDLKAAFEAEGLDPGRYAMFISTTWWETQTEVPAVEAVDEVVDEDGNIITEAVEAKEAYTRTDTYDTPEEAPAGAVERTRLGVRYNQLLAFIIGAI